MGAKDSDFPDTVNEAKYIRKKLSSSSRTEIQIIEGAGHYPHTEMPEKVQSVVISFLQQVKDQIHHDA